MRASPAEYNSALRPSPALHDAGCKLVLLFPLVFPSPLRPAEYKSALRVSLYCPSPFLPAECKSALRFPLSFPSPWLPAEYNSALPGRSQGIVLFIRWLEVGRLGGR